MKEEITSMILKNAFEQINERRNLLEKINLSYNLLTWKENNHSEKHTESYLAYVERDLQFLEDLNNSLENIDISLENIDRENNDYFVYKYFLSDKIELSKYCLSEQSQKELNTSPPFSNYVKEIYAEAGS